jgi:hypothetical protein
MIVIGGMWYQTVVSFNSYQKCCHWWLWSSKPTFSCHLSLELNLLAITNLRTMSVISGISMFHSVTNIISLEGGGKAIAKHKTIAYRGKYSVFIHIPCKTTTRVQLLGTCQCNSDFLKVDMGDVLILFLLFRSVLASDATLKLVTNATSESSVTQGPRLFSHIIPSSVI